ncbi:hypothetical protein COCVIDRAFT_96817, partial [Bipolaris victoriae FI3]
VCVEASGNAARLEGVAATVGEMTHSPFSCSPALLLPPEGNARPATSQWRQLRMYTRSSCLFRSRLSCTRQETKRCDRH